MGNRAGSSPVIRTERGNHLISPFLYKLTLLSKYYSPNGAKITDWIRNQTEDCKVLRMKDPSGHGLTFSPIYVILLSNKRE